MEFLGDENIFKFHKTAYLCSRKFPASAVVKSFDWAVEQCDKGNCIICGAHSKIEKDIFNILLSGTQPLILVLARGMKSNYSTEIKSAVENNRLLIVTPFPNNIKRITEKTSRERNLFMLDLADEIVIGYAYKQGSLQEIISKYSTVKYLCPI